MEFVNATPLAAGYSMATDKTGRQWIVVVAKGTFGIPTSSEEAPQLLGDQVPLVMCDEFTGEPGFSAPLYEMDFAPRKPRCDVLLNGSAHAPGGRPATKVHVTMQVGSLTKSFNVCGNRTYQTTLGMTTISSAEPFTIMPISYNNAFGGIDKPSDDPNTHQWYLQNPAGAGYHPRSSAKAIAGKSLPNTEEVQNSVSRPDGKYRPMAFGPIGRGWPPRTTWAGSYDKKWMDEKLPFLPDDFDERYFQCAPEDQQTDYCRGGEIVSLTNLTPQGRTEFALPALKEPFVVSYKNGQQVRLTGVVDTLILEPDLGRFTLSLRASVALRRNLHEVSDISVGLVLPERPRDDGEAGPVRAKTRYKSLRELIKSKRQLSDKLE
jgi:hypothetical protein